jgi:predicted ATP-dependent endonuclease of OLD family
MAETTKTSALLTDVTIEGLRGVGRVELSFAPDQRVYCLFGKNGVGKTKCLEALYQFLLASNKNFARRDFHVGHFVMACLHDAAHEVTFEKPKEDNYLVALYEAGKSNRSTSQVWGAIGPASPHDFPVVFLGAGFRASLADKNVQSVASTLGTFEDRREAYIKEILRAFASGDLRSLGMQGDTHDWFIKRAQSGNRHQESQDNREVEIEAVLSMLHTIEPRIDPDPETLRIDGGNHVFLKVDGEKRELGELSSGFAALLKMIQAIIAGYAAFTNERQLQNVRGIVFIDEIDAHLHAEWQVKIIPCLMKLFPNTTFYVATHALLVLKQLKMKEAYLLKRDDDGVVRSRMIEHPNRRLFVDVLEDGMGVDLNALDDDDDQSDLKQRMLSLLQEQEEGAA